jgi:hypothetical protein
VHISSVIERCKYFIAFIIVFIFVFKVNFNSLPIKIVELVSFISFVYCLLYFYAKKEKKLDIYLVFFIAFLFVQFTSYLVSFLLSDSNETSQIKVFIIFYVFYPMVSYFLLSFLLPKISPMGIKKLIIQVVLLQLILTVLIMLNNDVKTILLGMIDVDQERLETSSGIRMVGFSAVYLHLGTIMVLGFMFSLFYARDNLDISIKIKSVYYFFAFCFIFIGVFSARTALVGGFIVIFFYYVNVLKLKANVNNMKAILNLLIWFFIVGFLLSFFLESINDNVLSFFNNSLPWAFEMIFNVMSGDGLNTSSSDELSSMYFYPGNVQTIFLGDARMFSDSGYYMHTDAGYMRQIFSYGLLGLTISILAYSYVFYIISKVFGTVFSICLFLLVLVFNIKGIFIYYSSYDFIIVFMFIYSILFLRTERLNAVALRSL